MYRIVFILSLFLLPTALYAGVLKGKVTDEHGATLPYATIFIEGTTIGVNANGNGNFELPVAPGLYKVVCQYIGYKQSTFNLSVTGNETIEHVFVLKDQSLEMKEVVVHGNAEDPAYWIIRNAIKKRQFHLDQVMSFQTSIYLKGVARSRKMPKKIMGQKVTDETDVVDSAGKGVLYLTEEYADYYRNEGKEKTIIHSVHESGNPNGLGFSQFPPVITFYDNNVNIFGKNTRGFISPISENALYYYKYKLLGQFDEQGHTVYKIRVTPKRGYEPCFNGYIYIVDEDWAIHSLNMTLEKKSGMDIIDTLKVDQLFLPVQKDMWVIKSQVLYFTVKLLGFDITATGVTAYNKQKVNEAIPDSIFAGKIISAYDKNANKKDSNYWKESRPIPLEKDEHENFIVKDSLVKKFSDPAYIDSVRRKGNKFKPMGLLTKGGSFDSKEYKTHYSTNSILWGLGTDNMLNYNPVEGFNLAPKFSFRRLTDTGKYLFGDAVARYGFSNTHFNAMARLFYLDQDRSFPNRSWQYGIEGGKYVFQYNPENPVLPWYNTYASLFATDNDLKIYERWDATAFLGRNYGTGLSWYVKTSYQQRLPLENTTSYGFQKDDGVFKSNIPAPLLTAATAWEKNDAALVYASVSYKPGYTYTQFPDFKSANGSSWPRFTILYEKGIPGIINSVSNFDKWRFSIQDNVSLKLLGEIKYNFAAGGFLNTAYVSVPDLMHLYGNRGIGLSSPYLQSFQFAQYYEFSNKDAFYGEGHIEYHLNGLLSNKIPLLRQARWYLLFGGNAFYGSNSDYYSEAFIGIDNIGYKLMRPLRVDFVQSWDSHGGHNSGIRFGINLKGASTIRVNPMHDEW